LPLTNVFAFQHAIYSQGVLSKVDESKHPQAMLMRHFFIYPTICIPQGYPPHNPVCFLLNKKLSKSVGPQVADQMGGCSVLEMN
jgi:hypothetical protein